jgi:ribosomal protein S18 acetylase RimI-like enzyme
LVTVVSAFPADRGAEAAALVFEYMAATQAETGQPVPSGIDELPAALQHECRNLPVAYRPPGALLIADHDGSPAGCVGLAPGAVAGTAEINRLYVRPVFRRLGIAGLLMRHAHEHAARHGLTTLVLDVLPARTAVIGLYRRLGYTEIERGAAESPVPMIYMERSITNAEIQH